jgi:hypothetical protein
MIVVIDVRFGNFMLLLRSLFKMNFMMKMASPAKPSEQEQKINE